MLELYIIGGVLGAIFAYEKWFAPAKPAAPAHSQQQPGMGAGPAAPPQLPAIPSIPGLGDLPPLPANIPGIPSFIPGAAPTNGGIPTPDDFDLDRVPEPDGPFVAAFLPNTRKAMANAMRSKHWVVRRLASAGTPTVVDIGPPDTTEMANASAADAIMTAASLNMFVFMDADAALKLADDPRGASPVTTGTLVVFCSGLPPLLAEADNEEVAFTKQQAVEAALDQNFPGSRWVLFAVPGENF